jgi:hypothetical protein
MQNTKNDSLVGVRSLYLTEADPHRVCQGILRPLETHELRRQIFLFLLFWDNLIVSDAILNNNDKLRPLLLPEIEGGISKADILFDFRYLLERGYIKAAMREGLNGFKELLREHREPTAAPNLPTDEYAEALDELLPESSRLRWRRETVESYFKENLIKALSSKDPIHDLGIPKAMCESILNFIMNKGSAPITYRELRHLIEHPEEYPVSWEAAYQMRAKPYRDKLEELISHSYRFNVPAALELEAEATRNSLPWWVSFGDTSLPRRNHLAKNYQSSKISIRPSWIIDE